MCGYDCTGCGACYDKGKSQDKWAKLGQRLRGRCDQCGTQNTPKAVRCAKCGAELNVPDAADKPGDRQPT